MTTNMKEKFTGHLSALSNFRYAIKEQNGRINYNTCKKKFLKRQWICTNGNANHYFDVITSICALQHAVKVW